VLAGVLHGLSLKLDPGAAAIGNVTREPDQALPFDIDAALNNLAGANVLGGYLGDQMLALYRETKRIETQRLRRIISEAEYDWYL
jgi:glutamine synthetase